MDEFLHNDVKQLKEILNDYSSFTDAINDYQKNHKIEFNNKYYGFTIIWEKSIWLLGHILDLLNFIDKSNWKPYYSTQCVLICNTIPFIYSVFENILNWHYHLASVSNRTAFETLVRIYFINFYPENFGWIFWKEYLKIVFKETWVKYPEFKLKTFLEEKLEWRLVSIYHILSTEAHSNLTTVLNDLKHINDWKYKIGVNMKWDLDFTYNMNVLIMIIYALFRYIDDIFLKDLEIHNKSLSEEITRKLKDKDFLILFLNNYLYALPTQNKLDESINFIMKKIINLENNLNNLWKQ